LTTQNCFAPAHTAVSLQSLLVSYSNPDHGDTIRLVVEDVSTNESNRGGYLTHDGIAQLFNTPFDISLYQVDQWAFVAGSVGITDKVSITALDSHDASSGTTVAKVTAVTAAEHSSIQRIVDPT
jgi:hypothetical protein